MAVVHLRTPVVDQQHPISYAGAGLAFLGQFAVLPPTIPPEVRAIVSTCGAFLAAVLVPLIQRWGQEWVRERVGRREAERERDEARRALRDSQSELERLRTGQVLMSAPKRETDA